MKKNKIITVLVFLTYSLVSFGQEILFTETFDQNPFTEGVASTDLPEYVWPDSFPCTTESVYDVVSDFYDMCYFATQTGNGNFMVIDQHTRDSALSFNIYARDFLPGSIPCAMDSIQLNFNASHRFDGVTPGQEADLTLNLFDNDGNVIPNNFSASVPVVQSWETISSGQIPIDNGLSRLEIFWTYSAPTCGNAGEAKWYCGEDFGIDDIIVTYQPAAPSLEGNVEVKPYECKVKASLDNFECYDWFMWYVTDDNGTIVVSPGNFNNPTFSATLPESGIYTICVAYSPPGGGAWKSVCETFTIECLECEPEIEATVNSIECVAFATLLNSECMDTFVWIVRDEFNNIIIGPIGGTDTIFSTILPEAGFYSVCVVYSPPGGGPWLQVCSPVMAECEEPPCVPCEIELPSNPPLGMDIICTDDPFPNCFTFPENPCLDEIIVTTNDAHLMADMFGNTLCLSSTLNRGPRISAVTLTAIDTCGFEVDLEVWDIFIDSEGCGPELGFIVNEGQNGLQIFTEYFTKTDKMSDEIKVEEVRLIDLNGRIRFQSTHVNNEMLIPMDGLPVGIYIIQVKSNLGIHAQKLMYGVK